MPSNFQKDDPIFGTVDLDDAYITDAWLVDQFVGNQLFSWGDGNNGQLGLGNGTDRSSPVQIGSLTSWKQVSCGRLYTAITKTDGTLWVCGNNNYGQLGLGNTTLRSSPVQVGTLTNWKQVSAGASGVISAIKTDGTLWLWGYNQYGQLGLGDITYRSSPVQLGTLANWKQVSAGPAYSSTVAAIKTDGTLWMWGSNSSGQLGLGDFNDRSSPVQVGSLTGWKQVNVGNSFIAAIKTNGTLWTWGSNTEGQLGLGNDVGTSSPVQIGTLTNWKQLTTGARHVAAIKNNGTLWTWGRGYEGQLGNGIPFLNSSSPIQIGSLTNWKLTGCGGYYTLAVKTDGTLWGWGENINGYLGLGATTDRSSPVQVGSLTNWKQVSGGQDHSVGVTFTDIV